MSNTPPPYSNITGIYTASNKHQKIDKQNYDGVAKPGQLVVDTSDYSLWIGDDQGNLNAVAGGAGSVSKLVAGSSELVLSSDGLLTFPDSTVQTTAYAGGVGIELMIDTNRTDSYTEEGSTDRPFKTFNAAIQAAEVLNPTGTKSVKFVLMGCNVSGAVDFSSTNFNFITIATTSRGVFNGDVTIGNSDLKQVVIRNIEFGGAFTITGDGTATQLNNTSFYHVSFSGVVNITAANSVAFYECAFFGAVNLVNNNYTYINGAQFTANLTFTVDDSGATPTPANGIGPAIVIGFNFIANNLFLTKVGAGASFIVFQPHMSRFGLGAGVYTIPTSFVFQPQGCAVRGTWTNNGSVTLRNSSFDNAIRGTAPAYTGVIGGDKVVADLPPTTSKGAAGDRVGMIAADAIYLYICTTSWTDGVADIWTRTALPALTTW